MVLWAAAGVAQAQQDLIVVRSMPAASGITASTITYEISYKNAGPGSANGATLTEQLPNGFQVLRLSCVGAFGGAVCPTTTIVNNNPVNYPFPRIEGTIATFPEFSVVRVRVQMKLSASPGAHTLSGTIAGPASDPIAGTNTVLSSLYVRPLLLDLATSHSSTLPDIGGSNGFGGTSNVVFNGNTIASNMPLSVSYRIDNHGPDTAPGGAFFWQVLGDDDFAAWVSTSWTQATHGTPVGYEYYRYTEESEGVTDTYVYYEDARITPYTCTAIGSAVCPAPVVYRVADGWLARPPTVSARTIIGNSNPNSYYRDPYTKEVALADVQEANQNSTPLFGLDLAANAGLILTATLTNPRYGNFPQQIYDQVVQMDVPSYVPRDGMFTQTDQLAMERCRAIEGENLYLYSSVSYTDPNTGLPLASVSDNDLGNNEWSSNVGVTRVCPQADLVVTAQATVNGAPASTVRDGQNYAMAYTVTNVGPGNLTVVQIESDVLGTTFVPPLNWNGFTRAVSCTSSSPATSPCPSQGALDAWMASPGTVTFATPMASGASWSIVVSGNAGTTGCTPGTTYSSYYWQGNLRAWGVGMLDPNENNNYATSADRSPYFMATNACPVPPVRFNLVTSKTALSATTPATAVNVGDYAYFSITLRNASDEGISLRNVSFRDYINTQYYIPSGAYASVNQIAGPFQREAGQAAGLDIQVRVYDPATGLDKSMSFPSGIVCTAHGAAQCPASLNGYSSSYANAQVGGYSQIDGVIPLLPAGAGDYIELRLPWHALPDSYGCAPGTNNGRDNTNLVSAYVGEDTIAVFPDSNEVPASDLRYSSDSSVATVYNNLTPCPVGAPAGTVQKTLRGRGPGTIGGDNTTSYEAAVFNGETLTYDVVLTSNGTLGVNSYSSSDSKAQPICRDGVASNPSGVAGQARCGETVLTGLTCVAAGGAICPSVAELAAATAESNTQGSIAVSGGSYGDFAAPAIPVGGTLTFTSTYTVSGLNSFTGAFSNGADYIGQSGPNSFWAPRSGVVLNIPQAAGISLSKDVDKLQVGEGETVTYTIDITNGGNGPLAAGASFVDPLPAGLSAFTSVTCTGMPGPAALPNNGNGVCPGSITNNASGVSATLPQMLPNTLLRFTITAVAPVGGVITSIGNEARVLIPTGATQVTVVASANFSIPSARETEQATAMVGFKSVRNTTSGGDSVLPGEQLVYTISYANVGGMDIANFQITEALPSHVTYSGGASVSTAGPISTGSINPSYNGTMDTRLLAPDAVLGGAGAITITVPVMVNADVPRGTVITNQAQASGSGVTGTVSTDNVDNTNPACPAAAPAPCLPTGVSVPAGSVPQDQTAARDPVRVGVGARAQNPSVEPVAVPATSPALLVLLSLLLVLGAWGLGDPRVTGRRR